MSSNLHDLRFGIRRTDGFISDIWRLWITRHEDIYLTVKRMGGIEKYSFHKNGICRSAFTSEYIEQHGTPVALSDRLMFKWNRLPTPEQNSRRASRVAWIAFPTDYLSRNKEEDKKKIASDRKPSGQEVKNCLEFLSRQLELLKPKLIVCLGELAWKGYVSIREQEEPGYCPQHFARCNPNELRLPELVGRRFSWRGAAVIPMIHPSGNVNGARARYPVQDI